jgi:hypothetical protein
MKHNCDYLNKSRDCNRPFTGLIWPNKWLDSLTFIWSSKSYKWSLAITYPNFFKFEQIIVEDLNHV